MHSSACVQLSAGTFRCRSVHHLGHWVPAIEPRGDLFLFNPSDFVSLSSISSAFPVRVALCEIVGLSGCWKLRLTLRWIHYQHYLEDLIFGCACFDSRWCHRYPALGQLSWSPCLYSWKSRRTPHSLPNISHHRAFQLCSHSSRLSDDLKWRRSVLLDLNLEFHHLSWTSGLDSCFACEDLVCNGTSRKQSTASFELSNVILGVCLWNWGSWRSSAGQTSMATCCSSMVWMKNPEMPMQSYCSWSPLPSWCFGSWFVDLLPGRMIALPSFCAAFVADWG